MLAHSGLIGRAGEMLVAAELMRQGVEIAQPFSDRGVDLIAYRLEEGARSPTKLVTIQVKSASAVRFTFQKCWLKNASALVFVWKLEDKPEFYVFSSIREIEQALGETFVQSPSWTQDGRYTVTNPNSTVLERMQPHWNRWERITAQL